MTLRVVVTEDDPNYRAGLRAFLDSEPGFHTAAVFASAEGLLAAVETECGGGGSPPWDLALMDIQMPGMTGIEATRRLKTRVPTLTVVMLTVFEDRGAILEAICAGADGYLLKKATSEEIATQLRAIAEGGSPLTPGIARTVLELLRSSPQEAAPAPSTPLTVDLSQREVAVLRHLARGLSYKQVADAEGISLDTVRTYVRRVYRKLQVHSVAEAVGHAVRGGLV